MINWTDNTRVVNKTCMIFVPMLESDEIQIARFHNPNSSSCINLTMTTQLTPPRLGVNTTEEQLLLRLCIPSHTV